MAGRAPPHRFSLAEPEAAGREPAAAGARAELGPREPRSAPPSRTSRPEGEGRQAGGGGCARAPASALLTLVPSPQVESQEETSSIAPGGAETGSSESAALRLRVPPQQGQAQQSSASTVGERRRKRRKGQLVASLWAQTAWLLQMLRWVKVASCFMCS